MRTKIVIYQGDITDKDKEYIMSNFTCVAMDTETTGLNPCKDNLCLIQIYTPEKVLIIHYDRNVDAKNIKAILSNSEVTKVFHHATFDVRFLMQHLNTCDIKNVVCTKIAAKLIQGVSEKNSLKYLLSKYLDVAIDKKQQLSDWSASNLTDEQIEYAIGDVKYLISLKEVLFKKLEQSGLEEYVKRCCEYLPTHAYLLNNGIEDIFEY